MFTPRYLGLHMWNEFELQMQERSQFMPGPSDYHGLNQQLFLLLFLCSP